MTLAELLEAARSLTPAERIELADELMDSVEYGEPDPVLGPTWMAEFRRRIDDIDSGKVELVNHAETIRIARARIADRRARHVA
jgi:putative addiction module component (TIGR02574 family)